MSPPSGSLAHTLAGVAIFQISEGEQGYSLAFKPGRLFNSPGSLNTIRGRDVTFQQQACQALIQAIEDIDAQFLIHVPDSTVAPVIAYFFNHSIIRTFAVAREEEAVGIAAGLQMAGKKAVILIQDTGLGNSLTALTTFSAAYRVSTFLVVARRGGLGEINSAVHHFSDGVSDMLEALGFRPFALDRRTPLELWASTVVGAYNHCLVAHRPVIVLVDLKE